GHVFLALVHVFHVVADHLALLALDLDDVAAACLGLGLVAGHVVADHAAGHGAGAGGGLAGVALAHLVAQGGAADGADDGAVGSAPGVTVFDRALAALLGGAGADDLDHFLRAQDLGVAIADVF